MQVHDIPDGVPAEELGELMYVARKLQSSPSPGHVRNRADAEESGERKDQLHKSKHTGRPTTTHFNTWIRSATCDRAGVPDTANDDNLGISETISLEG